MRHGLSHVRHVLFEHATSFTASRPPPRDPFQPLGDSGLAPKQVREKQRMIEEAQKEESLRRKEEGKPGKHAEGSASDATKKAAEVEKSLNDEKPLDPPRPATKIVDSPVPTEEELQEIAASEPPPSPKQLPPRPPVVPHHQQEGKFIGPGGESATYLESDTEAGPAWGACDPREIFHVRQAVDAVRGDLPPELCLAEYTAADNSLQELQDGFDSWGEAKCGNDYWISDARSKCSYLMQCVANVIQSSPNARPEDVMDMKEKIRETMDQIHDHLGYVNYFMPEYAEAYPTPAMQAQYQQQFAAHQGDETVPGPGGPAPPLNPRKGKPPNKEPATLKDLWTAQDNARTPWTESKSPPSLIHSSLPECALLLVSFQRRIRPGHRRDQIARSFICDAH